MRASSRSQAIITTRNEIDKSAIAQILQLLTYLGFDVLVAGIKIAEMPLEGVDLIKREVALAERLHARPATASSTRRDAPARRRWSGGRGRIRGRTGASRWAGRFCCRCPRLTRRARVFAVTRGRDDRAGIPGRAFRRGGVCGLSRERDSRTPLPGPPPQGGRERKRRGVTPK